MLLLLACTEYGYSDLEGDKAGGAGDSGFRPGGGHEGQEDSGREGEVVETGDDGACAGRHELRLGLAVDDWWEAWIDGEYVGEAEHWWESTWIEQEVEGCEHVIAVHGRDLHQAISGFIAEAWVDGELAAQTGDGRWLVYEGHAPDGWHEVGYDDSAWSAGEACDRASATGWWGESPPDLRASGAWWIWPHECLDLGEASFRVNVDLR